MTSESTTTKDDDLELIKSVLREIIRNSSQGHDAGARLAAMRMLWELNNP
jgi:hypothetical protein